MRRIPRGYPHSLEDRNKVDGEPPVALEVWCRSVSHGLEHARIAIPSDGSWTQARRTLKTWMKLHKRCSPALRPKEAA